VKKRLLNQLGYLFGLMYFGCPSADTLRGDL